MKRNNIIILILCLCSIAISIGYSAFSQGFNVTGNATVDSTWDVKFSSITKASSTGSAYEVESPTYSDNVARFNVGFLYKGDAITYNVTVKNNGTLYAKIDAVTPTTSGSTAVTFSNTATNGTCIAPGKTYTFTVSATYSTPANLSDTNRVGSMLLTLGVRQSNSSCTKNSLL